MKLIRSIQQVAHHRNGIFGAPFYAILFTDKEGKRFLATVFHEPQHVAVICLDLLADHGVTFAENSWRGDHYEPELRAAIKAMETPTAQPSPIPDDAEPERFDTSAL